MVTIKDISRACGVSPATVSKALNGYGDVGAQTAERIRKMAQEMHYLPNAAARQLKTNCSRNIGVVFTDASNSGLTHEYFSGILNSVKTEAEKHGYDITFLSEDIGYGSYVEHCRYRKCDGVLLANAVFDKKSVTELIGSEIPVVTIDHSFDSHSCIISDNTEGGYALTRYLIEHGHRRIAFICGDDTSVTKKRLNGFYMAMEQNGIRVDEKLILEGQYHDTAVCAAATRKLMEIPKPPTAILYPDDFSWLGGMTELEQMGLSVPKDVSVVGYDGIKLSQVLRPRLTTWYQDTEAIGREAVKKLIEHIEKKRSCAPEQILVSGRLIEGGSVRPI